MNASLDNSIVPLALVALREISIIEARRGTAITLLNRFKYLSANSKLKRFNEIRNSWRFRQENRNARNKLFAHGQLGDRLLTEMYGVFGFTVMSEHLNLCFSLESNWS